jgi:general secretion pathway protein I
MTTRPIRRPPTVASRRPAPAAGFTLIEVMVALAIVAISLAAGARAASSVIDTSQRLSDIVLAQWCADNQLTELRLSDQVPPVGNTPFNCTQLGHDFKGVIKTQPTPNPSFHRVDAIISDATDRQLLTISTVMGH